MPFRSADDSWTRRRARYAEWLAEPESRLFLAVRDGRDVGYALVRVRGGESMLDTGERIGELESLSVLAEERGSGTGAALMDEVRAHLRSLGIKAVGVAVLDNNPDAFRFYERYGLRPYYQFLVGEVGSLEKP